ncbi:MAG: SusC/RagA family TonB-linked outer membrane protein, partial [Candidatus Cryptobacteroides sp.]
MDSLHKRLCCLAAIALLPFLAAHTAAGQVKVKGENLSIAQVIEQIQSATDYTFFYNVNDIEGVKASVSNAGGTLEAVLDAVFNNTGLSWKIQDKKILLKKSEKDEPKKEASIRTVKGVVVDDGDKSPLIGATVQIKGTDNVAITDIDGNFSIDGVGNKTILEVHYLGYRARDFRVGDLGFLEIALTSDNELEGVVVVGAGTQKKVSVTGSITAIKGDELKVPSSSLTNNLAGQLAGLVATTKSGKPGEGSEFYIRGIGTFGGRATPLILLDGIEITSEALNNIPPESIDQFSILKDASATAIYGSRGANGVLIITTKEGTENTKAKVSASAEVSVQMPTSEMEYVDGARWMEVYNEALTSRNPLSAPRYSQSDIDNTRSGVNPFVFPDVDWYNLLFKKFAVNERVNLNIQGGGSALTYYMSLQANHDTGLINCPTDYVFNNNYSLWKYIFQNNINYKIT